MILTTYRPNFPSTPILRVVSNALAILCILCARYRILFHPCILVEPHGQSPCMSAGRRLAPPC
jgi:hypothetical protein